MEEWWPVQSRLGVIVDAWTCSPGSLVSPDAGRAETPDDFRASRVSPEANPRTANPDSKSPRIRGSGPWQILVLAPARTQPTKQQPTTQQPATQQPTTQKPARQLKS